MSHANFIVLKPLNGICKPKFRVNSSHLDVQGFPWKECFVHIVKLGGLQYHYRSISPISIPQGSCSHGISVAFQTENSIYGLFGCFLNSSFSLSKFELRKVTENFARCNFGWGWRLFISSSIPSICDMVHSAGYNIICFPKPEKILFFSTS